MWKKLLAVKQKHQVTFHWVKGHDGHPPVSYTHLELAIETALGGNIQNIVTDTEETAKRMIQYLKKNKLGRATFLPLTGMRGNGGIREKEALKEKGVIGIASSLVQVEPRFKELSEQLLGRTIVVDCMDNGSAISRKYRQSLRPVSYTHLDVYKRQAMHP